MDVATLTSQLVLEASVLIVTAAMFVFLESEVAIFE